mgnify:FL=1
MAANTTITDPDDPLFIPSRTYMNQGDPVWDITYYLENFDGGLIAIDKHFTKKEDENYSNTYSIEVKQ